MNWIIWIRFNRTHLVNPVNPVKRFSPLIGLLSALVVVASSAFCQRSKIENPVPFGTIRSQRLNSGVPLGGIGCGTFQLLTDGTISRATINNNWSKPTGDLNGCFAAIWTNADGRMVSRALTLKSPYGLPSAAAVDYLGLFPRATVQFPDPALPVSVTLRAFTPLVPQDLGSSTIPAAIFVFTVRNEARAPIDASVAFSWENFLGVGGTASKGGFSDRTGNTVTAAPPVEGIFGMRMAGPSKPAADPETRFYYNAQGNYALMAQPTTPDTTVTTAGWNALDKTPGWWAGFERDGTVKGSVAAGREGAVHPAGVVALKVSLKAGESREIPFVVAWYTPRLYTLEGMEYGHFYQKMFGDSSSIARFALQNRLAFASLTDEWQNRLLRSTLPPWLVHRLINDAAILATNSIYTRDSGLASTKPGPSLFALLEQPGAGPGIGAMDPRMFAHALLAAFFPRLDLQELEQFAALQSPAGAIPRLEGSVDETIGGETLANSDNGQKGLVGSSASFAYQVAQYYFWTGDKQFLDRFYPAAKHALEFGATRAASLAVAVEPSETEKAMLRAALSAGARLADAIDDRKFAEQCRERAGAIRPASDSGAIALEQWMTTAIGGNAGKTAAAVPPTTPANGKLSVAGAAIHAALLTQLGSADAGLAIMQQADRSIVEQMRSPWSYSDGPTDQDSTSAGGSITAPASWNLLRAITGPAYDPFSGRLTLAPKIAPGTRSFSAPIFAPTFWATLDYRAAPTRLQIQFRLERCLPIASSYEIRKPERTGLSRQSGQNGLRSDAGASLVVKQVVLPAPQNPALQLSASLNRSPVTGRSALDGHGGVVFTPDSPVALTAGQRLEFLFRP